MGEAGIRREELAKIVGDENVADDPATLEEYSKDNSFTPSRKPFFVVYPSSPEEVREIVVLASRQGMPLIPVSSGPPRFKGDTVPSMGGVVVDLTRMNKVLSVDRRNRIAMIQPGVTFKQLKDELEKHGLLPLMPLHPKLRKSALASYLEREPITTPKYHWESLDPLLCTEAILGTGDVLRTGSAAGPGEIDELVSLGQGLANPLGPAQADFVRFFHGAQGTMGIVTWATVRCRIKPSLQQLVVAKSDSLKKLIPLAYRLLRRRIGEELLILNNSYLAYLLGRHPDEGEAASLPAWVLITVLAGYTFFPEERVEYQLSEVKEAAKSLKLELTDELDGVDSSTILGVLQSPSKEPYWKLRYKGGCQDVFFLTTLNMTPMFWKEFMELSRLKGYPERDVGVYIQPIIQGCAAHLEFTLPYDPEAEEELVRVFFQDASRAMFRLGAFYSRPYGLWAEIAYGGDAETTSVLRKLKGIFDPNGIFNPGKLCF